MVRATLPKVFNTPYQQKADFFMARQKVITSFQQFYKDLTENFAIPPDLQSILVDVQNYILYEPDLSSGENDQQGRNAPPKKATG